MKWRRSRLEPHKDGRMTHLQRAAKSATARLHVTLATSDLDEAGVLQKLEPSLMGLNTHTWPRSGSS